MNESASILQGAGVLLGVPALLFILGTGRRRMLRFKHGFEQRLINSSMPILAASIVGDLMFAAGCVIEKSWWALAIFAALDIASTIFLVRAVSVAQWELDLRSIDVAGMFWCQNCAEVHHIDADCHGDEEPGTVSW